MKASDLRIGNLVYYNGTNGPDKQINKIDGVDIQLMNDKEDYLKLHEAIPLTEELLKDFGFDDYDYKTGYIGKDFKMGSHGLIGDFVLTKPLVLGEFQKTYVFELRNHRYVTVPSVHELQNLFHALTGEELIKNIEG